MSQIAPLVPDEFVQEVTNLESIISFYSDRRCPHAHDVTLRAKMRLNEIMEIPSVKAGHRASGRALEELNRVVIKYALLAGRA